MLSDPTVLKVAKSHNVSAAEVGLRWILQQGMTLVTSSAKVEYDAEDIRGVWTFALTDAEMAQLSAVNATALD